MEFSVAAGRVDAQRSGCVVVGVHEGRKLSASAIALDAASSGALQRVLARGDLEGELGSTLLLQDTPGVASERVLLVGVGDEDALSETSYRSAICAAIRTLRHTGAVEATLCLNELEVKGRDASWKIEQAVLVVMEGLYRFDKLKSKPPPEARHALKKVTFLLGDAEASVAEAAISRGAAIAEGVALAKDLANLPPNLCTPAYLADQAREIGGGHGFKVTILEQADMERLGMGAFLAVARGSRQPPKLIVMEYRGAGDAKPIALVGKGITFDAGGISIKSGAEMEEMKFDMCGAATVFGALHASAIMKLALNIVAIIPATENMPGDNAYKPGDIVKTMSGQTVEILDTDAEGRVVLCDALTYAATFSPSAIVDLGTLTGGIVTALGDVASGMFSNDDALAREIVAAGETAWDRVWQMPLWDEYQPALKSNFADFANTGSNSDCAVTAACFLSRFTKGFPWVHLDIAGTASKSGEDKGATGRPVALLTHFLMQRAGS